MAGAHGSRRARSTCSSGIGTARVSPASMVTERRMKRSAWESVLENIPNPPALPGREPFAGGPVGLMEGDEAQQDAGTRGDDRLAAPATPHRRTRA